MTTGSTVLDLTLTLEALTHSPRVSRDRAGKSTFGDPVAFHARAVRADDVVSRPDGEEIRTSIELVIPADEDSVPAENSRVTRSNGDTYIVVELREALNPDAERMFYRAKCRDEGRG